MAEGEWVAAWRALLLFVTNLLSILLAGGGTLALSGLGAAATRELKTEARRKAFIWIAIGVVMVAIPLAATSIKIARESFTEIVIKQLAQDWVDQTDYAVTRVEANGNWVDLLINGSGEPPPLAELGSKAGARLNRLIELRLITFPSEKEFYETQPE